MSFYLQRHRCRCRVARTGVAYFGYDEPQKIVQRINDALTANPAEPINLIGHSYGASTAAQIASTINAPINQLILIDPVGRGSVGDFRSNVQTLITVTANPSSPNLSDAIAFAGGKGAGLPVDKVIIFIRSIISNDPGWPHKEE